MSDPRKVLRAELPWYGDLELVEVRPAAEMWLIRQNPIGRPIPKDMAPCSWTAWVELAGKIIEHDKLLKITQPIRS